MAEELHAIKGSKKEKYESLLPQIVALTTGENDLVANLSNIAAALKQGFNFFWVGFYIVKNNELVLGPFQGTVACTRIAKGKGVCGTAWQNEKTILVDDVDAFPGHIACSSNSKSEIAVPIFGIDPDSHRDKIVGVLDVDSDVLNDFDETDKFYLEKLSEIIAGLFDESHGPHEFHG